MSYNYTAICKKDSTDLLLSKFTLEIGKKYSYRTALNSSNEQIYIIEDHNDNRCGFKKYQFENYFYKEQELRRDKLNKINVSSL